MSQTFGPYTPVRKAGDTYYVSGQVGVRADKTASADVSGQTHEVLENMKRCLEEVGLTMDDVTKVTIYLTDMADFAAVNEVYQTYFEPPRPARACVQVAGLPNVANTPLLVEMDAVAHKVSS
ncbi:RidA family protein [Candidatus Saccharibacteria bacterium]|nr:RidA family protein [Candidatus Saccharibacteria bacterium]